MSDSYTTTTTESYGGRIKNALIGGLIGLLLFIASFFVLYINEGRVDLSKIAEESIEAQKGQTYDGKFISTSGKISSKEHIGDEPYIRAGEYIFLERKTEMFSWEEQQSSSTEENIGGSQETTTTYTYDKKWSENPQNSSTFNKQNTYFNPLKAIPSKQNSVKNAFIGEYDFSLSHLRLPKGEKLSLQEDILFQKPAKKLSNKEIILAKIQAKKEGKEFVIPTNTKEKFPYPFNSEYIYVGSGTFNNPEIGDIRISYTALLKDTPSTIFGTVSAKNIVPYMYDKKTKIFHLFDKNREESIQELRNEFLTTLWTMRGVGFLMMWIGLMMILSIFSTLLAFIPILGKIGKFLSAVISFVIALVLSSLTIFVGVIANNVFILVGIIVVVLVGGGIYGLKKNHTSGKQVVHSVEEENQV